MPEIRRTEKYLRIGVRDTSDFFESSLRTHDIGKKGFSKRIAGRLKATGKWGTQSFLVSHDESPEMKMRFFVQANNYIRKNRLGKPLSLSRLNRLM